MSQITEWLNTDNLLTVIVVLLGWMNRQNATIQKLLRPLGKFTKVATEFIKESRELREDTSELKEKIEKVEKLLDESPNI